VCKSHQEVPGSSLVLTNFYFPQLLWVNIQKIGEVTWSVGGVKVKLFVFLNSAQDGD